MTAAPAIVPERPSPERVDALAKEYQAIKKEFDEACISMEGITSRLDSKKEEICLVVGDFGSAHAQKSKILHGVLAGDGQSVSIDAAAVENFRKAFEYLATFRLTQPSLREDNSHRLGRLSRSQHLALFSDLPSFS